MIFLFLFQVLEVLVALMLAQARECLFEKLLLQMENMSLKDPSHVSLNIVRVFVINNSHRHLFFLTCYSFIAIYPEKQLN